MSSLFILLNVINFQKVLEQIVKKILQKYLSSDFESCASLSLVRPRFTDSRIKSFMIVKAGNSGRFTINYVVKNNLLFPKILINMKNKNKLSKG